MIDIDIIATDFVARYGYRKKFVKNVWLRGKVTPGTADAMQELREEICQVLNEESSNHETFVIGHSDKQPITLSFSDLNWYMGTGLRDFDVVTGT